MARCRVASTCCWLHRLGAGDVVYMHDSETGSFGEMRVPSYGDPITVFFLFAQRRIGNQKRIAESAPGPVFLPIIRVCPAINTLIFLPAAVFGFGKFF